MNTRQLIEQAIGEAKIGGNTDRGMVLAVAAVASAIQGVGSEVSLSLDGMSSIAAAIEEVAGR